MLGQGFDSLIDRNIFTPVVKLVNTVVSKATASACRFESDWGYYINGELMELLRIMVIRYFTPFGIP